MQQPPEVAHSLLCLPVSAILGSWELARKCYPLALPPSLEHLETHTTEDPGPQVYTALPGGRCARRAAQGLYQPHLASGRGHPSPGRGS